MGTAAAVRSSLLWALLLAPPSAWAATLLANYVLTARRCGPGLSPALSLIAAAMLLVVATAAVVAWRIRQRSARQADDEREGAAGTDRFMAQLALLGSALFAIAIAAQAVTPWFLHDCA